MRDRKCVMMVMFDVPAEGKNERKEYAQFHKFLIRSGYVRLQKSVYVKLLRSSESISGERARVREYMPTDGSIGILPLSLACFNAYEALQGEAFDRSVFADDVLFIQP